MTAMGMWGHRLVLVVRADLGILAGLAKSSRNSLILVAKRNAKPSETEVREWLEGNICRCTGYHNIVKAVQAGAKALRK